MVTIDVTNTFPSLRLQLMRRKVKKVVGENNTWVGRWIYMFMNKRRIRIIVNSVETQEREIGCGTPQGSLLSPILFTICLSGALEEKTINCVDDCMDVRVWKPGIVAKVIEDKRKRLKVVGIEINKKKTKACIFRIRKKEQKKKAPQEIQKIVTYLGMWIIKKLMWNDHIEY